MNEENNEEFHITPLKISFLNSEDKILKLRNIVNTVEEEKLIDICMQEFYFPEDEYRICKFLEIEQQNATDDFNKSLNVFFKYFSKLLNKILTYYNKLEKRKINCIFQNDMNIVKISDDIDLQLKLDSIYLSNNLLTVFSKKFCSFTTLTYLDLSRNFISYIPDEISNMINLTGIELSHNNLEYIPESFGNLTKLINVYLDNNRLLTIPDSINNLINVNRLRLDYNKLTYIPNMKNMKSLTELYLQYNKLTYISDMGNMLYILYMDHNKIKILPESLYDLKNLNFLYVNNNRISYISKSIVKLTKLQRLHLSNNDIKFLPTFLYQLSIHTKINISENPFEKQLICRNNTYMFYPNSSDYVVNTLKSFTSNYFSLYDRKEFIKNYFFLNLHCDTPILESLMINYPNDNHNCETILSNVYNVDQSFNKLKLKSILKDNNYDINLLKNSLTNMDLHRFSMMSNQHEFHFNCIIFYISFICCCQNIRYFIFTILYILLSEFSLYCVYCSSKEKNFFNSFLEYIFHYRYEIILFKRTNNLSSNIIGKYFYHRISHIPYLIVEMTIGNILLKSFCYIFGIRNLIIQLILFLITLELSMQLFKAILKLINFQIYLERYQKRDCNFCTLNIQRKKYHYFKTFLRVSVFIAGFISCPLVLINLLYSLISLFY